MKIRHQKKKEAEKKEAAKEAPEGKRRRGAGGLATSSTRKARTSTHAAKPENSSPQLTKALDQQVKLRSQLASAKAKSESAAARFEHTKEQLAELKERFRKFRSKNPDSQETLDYVAKTAGLSGPAKKAVVDELAAMYGERQHMRHSYKVVAEKATTDSTSKTSVELSYLDACVKYALDPASLESGQKLMHFVECGWIKKRGLSKAAQRQASEKGLHEAAGFVYIVRSTTKESKESAGVKRQLTSHDP